MKYRQLGRTGLQVSEIGFGCWAIGGTSYGPTKDSESLEALETAWDHGVNFFDTADTYGHGHSEDLLAKFLKNKLRDKVVVASKVGWDFYHPGGSRKNFGLDYIRFAIDESLKRLEIKYLDLYQLHNPSLELIREGKIIGVLEELKQQGKIRFIGISIHKEEEALAAIDDGRVDALQLVFNLLDQKMADRVFAYAQDKNIGVIVREPLACGFLTGKYTADHVFAKDDHRRRWLKDKLENEMKKIEQIKTALPSGRVSLTQAALEFVLGFDEVSVVIPGAKTREQVLQNLLAAEHPCLRAQEAFNLRELYKREDLFKRSLHD